MELLIYDTNVSQKLHIMVRREGIMAGFIRWKRRQVDRFENFGFLLASLFNVQHINLLFSGGEVVQDKVPGDVELFLTTVNPFPYAVQGYDMINRIPIVEGSFGLGITNLPILNPYHELCGGCHSNVTPDDKRALVCALDHRLRIYDPQHPEFIAAIMEEIGHAFSTKEHHFDSSVRCVMQGDTRYYAQFKDLELGYCDHCLEKILDHSRSCYLPF
jgi:hypothetical protein